MLKINIWIVGLSILFSQIIICPSGFAQKSKPIIFAGDQNYPPIEYLRDGKPTGMFQDLLQELSKVMGRKIEHQLGLWKESQKRVLNGEADALTVFGSSEERRKLYDFTESVFPMEFALFVQKDNLLIHTIDDLNGKKVGVTMGGLPKQLLAPKKQIHLVIIKNYSEGFRLLLSGKIEAVAANKWVGAYTLQHEGFEGVNVVPKPFATNYAPMAVKKGNLKLLNELNEGIIKLKKTGTIDEITRRWSSQEIVYMTKEKIREILTFVGIAVIIIVVFIIILWAIIQKKQNYKLRQEIVERQRAEEALGKYQENLENLVTTRTVELSTANAQLQREITEHNLTEETLKESENRFRQLFEYAPDGYYLTDLEGNFIDGNRAAEVLTGYQKKELIGKNFIGTGLLSVEQVPKAIELLKQNAEGKTTGPDEFTLKRKDGVEVIVEIRNLPTKIGDKNIILGIARDITEQKRLEAKLQQVHKMEAIATLAGGIAHEFNNALTGVLGNIQLLEMDLHENKTATEYTEAMKVSSQRMVNLTSQLLAYARGGKYQDKTISSNDFVEDTLPIIKPNIDPSIRLETDLPRGVSNVKTDPTQMQLVLSALLSNSSEAIDGEGRIRIIIRNKEIDEEFTKSHPEINPGRYVCLTVEDDGKGMDKETLNKIFDPFYTTKFMGRGLGMAAVYGIVRNHDGWISVDSEQGKGTIVRIYLPAFEGKKEKVREIPPESIELITGTGTILVIEDEETVMDVIRDILDKLGYRILEARSGKEAIEMAGTFDGNIDLALLDIKLPDIWGDKVYPQLMEARPDLKVIVCTGYSIDGPAQTILDAGAQDFIQKPFTVETLSAKLKKVMEGK